MTDLFALVLLVSAALCLFGYWRARRLHARIRAIEPAGSRAATHLFDRPRRKGKP
jgi:hypothetical protein